MKHLAGLKLAMPIDGLFRYTDFFGTPRDYNAWGLEKKHEGVDIAPLPAGRAADALSARDGYVDSVGYDPKFMGHYVVLAHEYEGRQFATRYHHLRYAQVITGIHIREGISVGVIGDTGYSTGAHLHFMVMAWIKGKLTPVDPLWYLPYKGSKEAVG